MVLSVHLGQQMLLLAELLPPASTLLCCAMIQREERLERRTEVLLPRSDVRPGVLLLLEVVLLHRAAPSRNSWVYF